jgi:hypothetical protein
MKWRENEKTFFTNKTTNSVISKCQHKTVIAQLESTGCCGIVVLKFEYLNSTIAPKSRSENALFCDHSSHLEI